MQNFSYQETEAKLLEELTEIGNLRFSGANPILVRQGVWRALHHMKRLIDHTKNPSRRDELKSRMQILVRAAA